MKITTQTTLSQWVPLVYDRPHGPYVHFIEGAYHSPHGTVEMQCWQTAGQVATGNTGFTQLRMVVAGIGWEYKEAAYYPVPRLLRLALAFANVVHEAAGAQQQFVSDGAGMVTMAIDFARTAVLGAQEGMQAAGLPYTDPGPDQPHFGSLQPTEC